MNLHLPGDISYPALQAQAVGETAHKGAVLRPLHPSANQQAAGKL
ncbi:MAG: hypothetical protein WCA45_13210 [Thiobacillaceae bacterium]